MKSSIPNERQSALTPDRGRGSQHEQDGNAAEAGTRSGSGVDAPRLVRCSSFLRWVETPRTSCGIGAVNRTGRRFSEVIHIAAGQQFVGAVRSLKGLYAHVTRKSMNPAPSVVCN